MDPEGPTGWSGLVCTGGGPVLVLSTGGARPAAAEPPPISHYKCYDIAGPPPGVAPVELVTHFGAEPEVEIGPPVKLCLPAGKNGDPIPPDWPHLKCYAIAGHDPNAARRLETQFGIEADVDVGQASMLCIPATKTVPSEPPGPEPPPDRHYECFDIMGDPPAIPPVSLETQFGFEQGVLVGQPTKLCAPARKNGGGYLGFPYLKCYNIVGPPLDPPKEVNLTTQFGDELGVLLSGPPSMLCVPALSGNPVGGIAEHAGSAGAPADAVATAEEGSGSSSAGYAALAGRLAAASVVFGTGAWYARRRSSRG